MVRRGMQQGEGGTRAVALTCLGLTGRGSTALRFLRGAPRPLDFIYTFLLPRRDELHATLPRRPWLRPSRSGYEKGCVVSEDKWEGGG